MFDTLDSSTIEILFVFLLRSDRITPCLDSHANLRKAESNLISFQREMYANFENNASFEYFMIL